MLALCLNVHNYLFSKIIFGILSCCCELPCVPVGKLESGGPRPNQTCDKYRLLGVRMPPNNKSSRVDLGWQIGGNICLLYVQGAQNGT